MLILTRRREEEIEIGDGVGLTVLDIRRGRVRVGVSALVEQSIRRAEIGRTADLIEDGKRVAVRP